MDDEGVLRGANALFYKALEGLDLAAMDRLWLQEDWVRCVHPGWDVVVGWEPVRQSWARIFSNTRWLRVTPTAVEARCFGDVGLVTCTENISAENDGDVGLAAALATNLFRRTPGGWLLFHHHASPAPVQLTGDYEAGRRSS